MEFAGALRQAIQASGLTLERIRHRLGRRGLTVSVATLSYWQRGRSRPRSRVVVVTLEEILGVPPGTLTELLDDPVPATLPARGGTVLTGPANAADRARAVGELWPDPDQYAWLVGQLDRSGDHRLERLSIHDVYRLDGECGSRTLSVRAVLRAAGDDIDRVVYVHRTAEHSADDTPSPGTPGTPAMRGTSGMPATSATPATGQSAVWGGAAGGESTGQGAARRIGEGDGGAELTHVRYCRPGRVRAEGGLMAFELVFDRVLSAGDTAVVEYELGPLDGGSMGDSYDRRFPHPVHDYVAIIEFEGDTLPARCYGFTAESSRAPRRRLGELWIGTSGSANIAVGAVRRGIVGIEWEWR